MFVKIIVSGAVYDADDDDLQVDIDNILLMAETHSLDEMKNSATDELLSQFKVPVAAAFYCKLSSVHVKDDAVAADDC